MASPAFASKLITLGLFALAAACASKDGSDTPLAETALMGPEAIGILSFFGGSDHGVVVRNVQWGKPVTPENPGADCELKLRKQGPPQNVFSCVVKKEGEVPVVLSLIESVDPAHTSRKLVKITVDGKSQATHDRWLKDLASADYAETKASKKPRRIFRSADGKSEAQVIWAPQAGAVTVIVLPAGSSAAPKPAAKKSAASSLAAPGSAVEAPEAEKTAE